MMPPPTTTTRARLGKTTWVMEAVGDYAKSMAQLQRTLGPVLIWGLGVGYVISGMYFGWNLGLPVGGAYGMLVATAIVTVLYVCLLYTSDAADERSSVD